jgi:TrmH family RNA methyltransferase
VLAVARLPTHDITNLRLQARATLLVLDAVQDPGNLGTLIRSADAFGTDAVIALPGTADFWSSKVIRSTAGSAFRRPLINAAEDETWSWLSQHDVVICGADMEGQAVTAWSRPARVALVVGNEGAGLRVPTRARVDQLISIPMRGAAESLNVAVAAGILLYELSKQG